MSRHSVGRPAPGPADPLAVWLDYIGQIHVSAIDMGLERVRPVAQALDVLQPEAHVVTVAGTNGKGSTTTAIASIYQQAGYRVGLYQSPHVFRFNERIRINGELASDAQLVAAFMQVEQARQQCGLTLSFFEFTTLAAFWLFRQAGLAVWVLEVGLGGRLDVVNLLDADVAVLTNVGLDHTDWLGDTREAIGFEKAGIFRAGKPVILGSAGMPESVWERIHALQCPVMAYGQQFGVTELPADTLAGHASTVRFWLDSDMAVQESSKPDDDHPAAATLDIEQSRLTLAPVNLATAWAAVSIHANTVDRQQVISGLAAARLTGRFEQVRRDGQGFILDVAHNPHGAAFLAGQLRQAGVRSVQAVYSSLADKDMAGVIAVLNTLVECWHVAPLHHERAASMAQLTAALQQARTSLTDDSRRPQTQTVASRQYPELHAALQGALRQAQPDQPVLIFGSFHVLETLGPALGLGLQ